MTPSARQLKLGTRRSLLAWAQSSWVAREIERLNPGVTVELVGIDTRGDKILDVSLQKVEGKEFFVAELDDALREKRVDFTVHSMKDLSLDRPEGFVQAAIPKREDPRDIVFFGPEIQRSLVEGREIRIGTSSPRRAENLPAFLAEVLPRPEGSIAPRIVFTELRGNVNTRLSRLHEPEGSDRRLDGVILALAGIARLHADEKAKIELDRLLSGVRRMILPLTENPTAPAQGALAVECRADDAVTRAALAPLHDSASAQEVARERAVLSLWGGGCHQRFGATSRDLSGIGPVLFVKGSRPDGREVDLRDWQPKIGPSGAGVEASSVATAARRFESLPVGQAPYASALFVAHSRAFPDAWVKAFAVSAGLPTSSARIWTAGTQSWRKLAARGIWVEGCAEGLGVESIESLLLAPVLGLPPLGKWTILTHEGAVEGWSGWGARVLPAYRVKYGKLDAAAEARLRQAKQVYWGSPAEWEAWSGSCDTHAEHACGPGKTYATLRDRGVRIHAFPSKEEWMAWLEQKREKL